MIDLEPVALITVRVALQTARPIRAKTKSARNTPAICLIEGMRTFGDSEGTPDATEQAFTPEHSVFDASESLKKKGPVVSRAQVNVMPKA